SKSQMGITKGGQYMRSKAGITLLIAAVVAVTAVAVAAAATDGAGRVAAKAAPAATASKCAKTMNIGFAGPITGGAAELGKEQLNWVKFAVAQLNHAVKRPKFGIVQGDTQLPNVAE